MAEIALAWVLANPVVAAPIVGATDPAHLDDAAHAVRLRLDDEEIAALQVHYTPGGLIGF